ncbi:MAG TPA: enoyl-CoA hydratase/isomerase family protein [Fontimonas sp.]
MTDTAVVLLREVAAANGRRIGFAQLNAEKSLNSLSLPMIEILEPALRQWAADPDIAMVVLHGAGEKALCAGGDIRSLYQAMREHPGALPNPPNLEFFSREYRLDHDIHEFPKPFMVWGSGIVMGGGLGLMAGASHRVVTETSRVAMPEITIGLFPDVGGSYFLSRMPRAYGLFLALSGASINGHDLKLTGLADHFVKSTDRDAVFAALASVDWTADAAANAALLTQLLEGFGAQAAAALPASNLETHRAELERLTAGTTLAQVHAAITGYQGDDAWLAKAAKSLAAGSPTTAALVWALLERARGMSLADVFRMELIVALQCCAHADFVEGVRALLIDKDNRPNWSPATLDAVTAEHVAAHFVAPVWPTGTHPLADL